MPKLQPKAARLTEAQVQSLVDGGLDAAVFGEEPFASDAQMKKAWRLWGDEITADYTRQHPNRRPWMWWHARGLPCPTTPEGEAAALEAMGELTTETKGSRK